MEKRGISEYITPVLKFAVVIAVFTYLRIRLEVGHLGGTKEESPPPTAWTGSFLPSVALDLTSSLVHLPLRPP